MVFSSLTFLCIFLPVVFLAHQVIPNIKAKNALLVVFSLGFYAYGEPIYVLLMIASTIFNWAAGLLIGKSLGAAGAGAGKHARGAHAKVASDGLARTDARTKAGGQARKSSVARVILAIAVVVNLAFLGVFKYANMCVESLNGAFGLGLPLPEIVLPIGISFYTFQAMSYVIDVYRGVVGHQKNYFKVLLYISFFPQLIAGPIVKYHDIELELAKRHANMQDIACGLRRFIVGLSKKVLIANTMGACVDSIYQTGLTDVNVLVAWLIALAYLLQIYFDFSGYSDMAIGMARMFGFHFKENFDHPYTSTNIKEFWRRWHISLSTWFKEYVYIPLGGNRRGKLRAVINKLIVFFLCGLWHGAAWTFVVWGLIHGLFLLLEEYLPIRKLPRALGVIYTLLVVSVAFVLFRAETFDQAWLIVTQMFTGFHFESACMQLFMQNLTPVFIITFVCGVVASTNIAKYVKLNEGLSFVAAVLLLALCILSLSTGSYNPFIYFRF